MDSEICVKFCNDSGNEKKPQCYDFFSLWIFITNCVQTFYINRSYVSVECRSWAPTIFLQSEKFGSGYSSSIAGRTVIVRAVYLLKEVFLWQYFPPPTLAKKASNKCVAIFLLQEEYCCSSVVFEVSRLAGVADVQDCVVISVIPSCDRHTRHSHSPYRIFLRTLLHSLNIWFFSGRKP